jgi:hypothetical protein
MNSLYDGGAVAIFILIAFFAFMQFLFVLAQTLGFIAFFFSFSRVEAFYSGLRSENENT